MRSGLTGQRQITHKSRVTNMLHDQLCDRIRKETFYFASVDLNQQFSSSKLWIIKLKINYINSIVIHAQKDILTCKPLSYVMNHKHHFLFGLGLDCAKHCKAMTCNTTRGKEWEIKNVASSNTIEIQGNPWNCEQKVLFQFHERQWTAVKHESNI